MINFANLFLLMMMSRLLVVYSELRVKQSKLQDLAVAVEIV